MIGSTEMTVNLRVPARTIHQGAVERLTAKAENGNFGVLPNHIDFVAALVPGVLTLVEPSGRERFFGVDEGVFVKQGSKIDICVRRAVEGEDLAKLTATVLKAFVELDDHERTARTALARLEANMVRRFAELRSAP
ncbi:MAG TPA: F0F1 ATP synthase subunit epsilon [Thermohalobaculum sp.]|nr:F0F1 ATP synthase subunit epsilon [Thermohalobaculum sp.]